METANTANRPAPTEPSHSDSQPFAEPGALPRADNASNTEHNNDPGPAIGRWLAASKQAFGPRDRPLVTLCYAQSLDGSIALRPGEPLLLSGASSARLTHQLRSFHDGILVGINTVLSDDPQLSVRHCSGTDPQPIVLDSRMRMPTQARLCCRPDKRCWVLTTQTSEPHPVAGLEITALESDLDGRVSLHKALTLLRGKGITTLMVEGGAHVITAFLKAQLADAVVITIAPRLVGGYKAVGDLELAPRCPMPRIADLASQPLGEDLIVWGKVQYGASV